MQQTGKKTKIILGLILLLAAGLRVFRLDYLELFGDEVDAGYQSYSLSVNGRDYKGNLLPAYLHSFSEWRAPGLMYAMVPFIKILGLNEWGVRGTSVFFGLLLLVLWWKLLGWFKVDDKTKLLAVGWLAIIPWQIQYSRTAFELTLMSSMLVLGTYYWMRALGSKNRRYIVFAGLAYCAALYTYNTANLYVPLLVWLGVIIYGWQWKKILWLGIFGIAVAAPLIKNFVWGSAGERFGLFSVWNNKEIAAEVIELRNLSKSTVSKFLYNKYVLAVKKVVFNYTNAFGSSFLFGEGDVTFRHSLHRVGNLYWIMLPLILLGMADSLRKGKKEVDKMMWGLTLLAPIPSSLTIDGFNHASRLFLMTLPLTYWAARGAALVKGKVIVIVVTFLVFEVINYQYYYWTFYRQESWRWWHVGYKEMITKVEEHRNEYQRVLIENTYEPALIRYLFWSKSDPKDSYGIQDRMYNEIDGYYLGFKLPEEEVYLVNFRGGVKADQLKKGSLYVFSQDRNVGGDWDLSRDTPEGIKIIDTIRNYDSQPLFYLATKDNEKSN